MRSRLCRSKPITGRPASWFRRAAILIACLTAGQLAILGAGTASADGTLSITPGQGPVGTQIYVQPVVIDSIDANVVCYVSWDKVEIAKFRCGIAADQYVGISISATGAPGPHWISVTCLPSCNYSEYWQDSASFTVLSTVPSLLGLSYGSDVIAQRLTAAGLTLGTQWGSTDSTASVISQKPAPGAVVQPGSPVELKFGSPPLVTVPDLKNATEADAGKLLAGLNLKLGSVRGTGRVVQQIPRAGSQVPPRSAVDIVLSPPPVRPVPVPDLTGLTIPDASRLLNGHRLTLGRVSGAGRVVRQYPPKGSSALPNTSVDVVLQGQAGPVVGGPDRRGPTSTAATPQSSLSTPPLVLVPNLRGLGLGDARATAQASGLRIDAGGATTGTVIGQGVPAGSEVALGSVVPVTVAVPSRAAATASRQADPNRHGWHPANWNIVALALILLAILLICTTGLFINTKRLPRRRLASHVPGPPDGLKMSYRLAESRLKTTSTGPTPHPVRVDLHGPIADIEIKEVPR